MPTNPIRAKDDSGDHKYFILTPQIVWAEARNPYDYTLWNVIKMIAGDDGECYLGVRDLAALAMMSVGQVTNSRTYLLKRGLLEGQLRKDPGHRTAVWHLTVPNLWPRNIAWRTELGDKLKGRVVLKKQQRRLLRQARTADQEEGLTLFEMAGMEVNV